MCERAANLKLGTSALGHLCNALTHVRRLNWQSIEAAIGAILPRERGQAISTAWLAVF